LTIIFLDSIFRAFLLYLLPILFTNFGLLYTKCVSLRDLIYQEGRLVRQPLEEFHLKQ
jgi:hypothetical protein